MSFFNKDFIDFFAELEQNNDREWFQAQKKRYELSVKQPFVAFVEEMIARIHAEDPELAIQPKDAIFRIHRDVRFAKDKSPYKTHAAAVISRKGRKDHSYPGLYMQFGAHTIAVAGGLYAVEKNDLYSLRQAIAEQPEEFTALLADKSFRKYYGEVRGEQNKVLPKEFKAAALHQPLIANKQFYFWAELSSNLLTRKDLADRLMKYYAAGRPLSDFLKRAIGAS